MCSESMLTLLFLPLSSAVIPDREKEDDKQGLEKRTAQVSQGADIRYMKDGGLVWTMPKPPPRTGEEKTEDGDAKTNASMFVEANHLEEGEDIAEHICGILSNMCVEHQQGCFACFQIAIGSKKDIRMPSSKKQSKDSINNKTKKSAAFTGGPRRYSA